MTLAEDAQEVLHASRNLEAMFPIPTISATVKEAYQYLKLL